MDETVDHQITLGVGYTSELGEGIVAECECGWSNMTTDGATLTEALAGHREQAERLLELADIGGT